MQFLLHTYFMVLWANAIVVYHLLLSFLLDQAPVIVAEESFATTGTYHQIEIDASASYDDTVIASYKWIVKRR